MTCGLLVFGLVLIKICLFFRLVFSDFCIADCSFINFHGHFALSIYCKTTFGRVFVSICSFWACFFGFAFLFLYLTNLLVLCFFEFSYQTHVGLVFPSNYPFWACFQICLFLQNNLSSLAANQSLTRTAGNTSL